MNQESSKASLWLFCGAVCIAFAPILVKAVSISASLTAFYRTGLAAVMLFVFLIVTRNFRPFRMFADLSWRGRIALACAGLLFCADLAVWHRSIHYVGAGIATILANTQVFYLGAIGIFVGRETPSIRFLIAVPLALIGIYLLAATGDSSALHGNYWPGIWLGMSTGIIYASYIFSLRVAESHGAHLGVQGKIFWVSLITTFFLALVVSAEDGWALPADEEWKYLLLLALIPQVAGWIIITKNLPKLPISKAGLIMVSQPVIATLLGHIIFDEALNVSQTIGAGIAIGAIYLGSLR